MKKITFIPIIFFTCFLIVLYLLIPNYSVFSKLQKQIAQRQIEVKEKQAYVNNLKKIKVDIEKYQEFLNKIENSLPQDISLASLLNFFQNKASASGLVMENMALSTDNISNSGAVSEQDSEQDSQENKEIKETAFRVNVIGSFESFRAFLLLLEKSSRLIEVESISFSSSGKGNVNEQGGVVEVLSDESNVDGKLSFKFSLLVKVYSY